MVQILDVSKLDRSNKLQENTSIAAQDHQGLNERIKFYIDTIRANRINVHVEKRTFSANRSEGNRYFIARFKKENYCFTKQTKTIC